MISNPIFPDKSYQVIPFEQYIANLIYNTNAASPWKDEIYGLIYMARRFRDLTNGRRNEYGRGE